MTAYVPSLLLGILYALSPFLSSEHIKQVTYLHLQMKILEQKLETLSDFPSHSLGTGRPSALTKAD